MSPLLILGKMILRSHATKWRTRRGAIEADFGSTHVHYPVEQSLRYIQSCFDDYVNYGRLNPLDGLEILEGGPGDNFGIGMLMLAQGARRYVGIDAFYSKQDTEQQRRIYTALRATLPEAQQTAFDQVLNLRDGIQFNSDRLQTVYGSGLGDVDRLFPAGSFDVVMSRAVLEQVHDVARVFAAMDRVLKPGGVLLHKIDLSDYGIFSGRGQHPLTQLTLPDSLYGLLAPNTGQLNRWTLPAYRQLLQDMGYRSSFYRTGVIGAGYPQRSLEPHPEQLRAGQHYGETELALVREIRPRLGPRFQSLSDDDLITAGVFVAARKPK